MKIEINKESIKKDYLKLSKKKWFSILKKILLILVMIYFLAGLGFAIAIYSFHKQDSLPKTVYSIYSYPAAVVNFRPIWVKDVLKQISYIKKFNQETQQPLPDDNELTDQIINQLIDTELFRQQAAKYGIKVTNKEVNEAFDEMAQKNNGEEEVKKILKEMYGMDESDFKKLIKNQLMMDKMQKELFVQVKARHILIKDEGHAKDVLEEVKKGERSFEDIAKEHSEDQGSKENGGDLGWIGRGMMVPEFEEAVFETEPGQMKGELAKTDFGYHIIKVEEKKGEIDESYVDWSNEVKEKSKIYIFYNKPLKDWFKNVARVEEEEIKVQVQEGEAEVQDEDNSEESKKEGE